MTVEISERTISTKSERLWKSEEPKQNKRFYQDRVVKFAYPVGLFHTRLIICLLKFFDLSGQSHDYYPYVLKKRYILKQEEQTPFAGPQTSRIQLIPFETNVSKCPYLGILVTLTPLNILWPWHLQHTKHIKKNPCWGSCMRQREERKEGRKEEGMDRWMERQTRWVNGSPELSRP